MKFDKTFIAIRDRSILEIFDLSLHVVTDHFKSLFWLLVIGAVPWIALDLWLIGWMTDTQDYQGLYYWVMLMLVVCQAQVGTVLMTHYLGQAMFVGRPGVWATVRNVFKSSPYLWWVHGALRLVVPVALCCLLISANDFDAAIGVGALLIPLLVGIGVFVRAFRPFVSEILLLEQTPVSTKDEKQVGFSKRSNALHSAASSDLIGRFMTAAFLSLPLGFACFSMFVTIDSVLNIRANSESSHMPYYWIAALWIIAGFISVTRFLSYIDIRIRQEGWAVELRMRAEGQLLVEAIE
jgi:hypothetical protein